MSKIQLKVGVAALLIGGGVAAGAVIWGGSKPADRPVIVQQVADVASSPVATPSPTVVKKAPAKKAVAPAAKVPAVQPNDQQPVVQDPAPVDPSADPPAEATPSEAPTADPTPTVPVEVFQVTPDSEGRAGNAPPPPPAPTRGS